MTIFMIIATVIVGILMFVIGKIMKKKWLVNLAFIPLAIAIFQLGMTLILFL